ncbi:hypothetical protein OG302_14785 [Streptomyces sp. NBC_01283]|uniref:hypothetical protein n=1 Tax=Streptomyces sp. NBC_01283 TaxID=2903812 RepID=UPI00352D2622|nr:hypothetical protein OG302_14785 [Streptomyces sp. NBC_01283]
MSETFAATVAGEAPVILLVAVLEIGSRTGTVRSVFERLGRQQGLIDDLYSTEQPPTGPQVEAVGVAISQSGRHAVADVFVMLYVASAVGVGCLLLGAEVLVLRWLAIPQEGPVPLQAAFCLAALVLGFAWVMSVPMIRMIISIGGHAMAVVKGVRRSTRFYRDLRSHRQESRDGRRR